VAYNRIKKQRGCAPLTVLWRLHSGRPSHPTLVARLGRGSMPLSPCFLPINTGEERAEKGRRMVWDREKNHKKKTGEPGEKPKRKKEKPPPGTTTCRDNNTTSTSTVSNCSSASFPLPFFFFLFFFFVGCSTILQVNSGEKSIFH